MLKIKEPYYKGIQKDLENYLYEIFYAPLIDIVKDPIFYNNINDLVNAILKGRIVYKDGEFTGTFSVRTSKPLSKFATFDKRSKSWKVKNFALIPPSVKSASVTKTSKNEKMRKEMDEFLSNAEEVLSEETFTIETPIGKTIEQMEKQLEKDLSPIGIQLTMTEDQKQKMIQDYNLNQTLNIKKWEPEQIQRLRDLVTKINQKGFDKKSLVDLIQAEWGVSRNKAKFLARQETSLFLSKFRREQSLQAGVRRYRWSSSKDVRVRERHEELNGKVFFYGDPPIVDTKTGRRAEPGEDYNCRCVAIPILEAT
jgi:SPP1 gp7 family putative phage head morphogenesis protein